jgi:hypothetical protein
MEYKQKELEEIYKNQLDNDQLDRRLKEIDAREKITRLRKEQEIEKEHINRIVYNNMLRSMK